MDLIDNRDEVLRTFIEYGITENTENDLTKKDLADCAEKIVEKLILSGVSQQRELLNSFIEWATENRVVEQQNINEEILENYLKTIL